MNQRYPYTGRGTGSGYSGFEFKESEKKELLGAWGGSVRPLSRNVKAESYILRTEKIIRRWEAFGYGRGRKRTPGAKIRDQVEKYSKAIDTLQAAYTDLPNDAYSAIDAFTNEALFLAGSPHSRVRAALLDAIGTRNGYGGLNDADDFIKELLMLMVDGAQRTLSNIKPAPGPDTGHIKLLVEWLARAFIKHFNKPAGYASGANFRRYLTVLASILDIEIGEDLIKQVLQRPGLRKPQGS